jgi:hypothetical protein
MHVLVAPAWTAKRLFDLAGARLNQPVGTLISFRFYTYVVMSAAFEPQRAQNRTQNSTAL